jgi:hypothetical protein
VVLQNRNNPLYLLKMNLLAKAMQLYAEVLRCIVTLIMAILRYLTETVDLAVVCPDSNSEEIRKAIKDEIFSRPLFALGTDATGFGPAISALTGQRVRPLHHASS